MSEGNIGNIHVPGRQGVFSSSCIHLMKTVLKESRFSKAIECFSRGRVKVVAAFFRAGFCFHSWQGRQGSLHLPMLQCVPCSAPFLQCGTSTGDDLKGFLDLVLLIGKIQRECTGLKTKSGKSLHAPKAWRFVGFSSGLLFFGMFSLVFLNFF